MQDAKPTGSQQIADHNGQFDPHLFQQTLHLTLQPYPVAPELQFHPRQVPPTALFPIRDKTQDQLVCDQPPHQPLGILEVMLAPPRGTVGECLRQLQTHVGLQPPTRPIASTGPWIPSLLPPPPALAAKLIIGVGHLAWWQIVAVLASTPAYSHRSLPHQHFLVYVNSCDLVGHCFLPAWNQQNARSKLSTVTCHHPSHSDGWRNPDWFTTRVPDQTLPRSHFTQGCHDLCRPRPPDRTRDSAQFSCLWVGPRPMRNSSVIR